MHNISLVENNVAQYLKQLTDTTQFSQEQIMVNLKDCLKGKKCCIFSCGANIDEHKDKFEQIKNDKSFITCCIKSAIERLQFKADILTLYGCINGTYLENEKLKNIFILKTNAFEYDGISYDLSNFNIPDFKTNIYHIINFLNYIGIKEIYLFGYYLSDYIINDLTNYNYYDDIVSKQSHTYDVPCSKGKEPDIFLQHCDSIRLANYCIDNNILLFNVSEYGCLSNKIKRINFESIFLNEKTFIFSKINYKDFLDEFEEKVDIDFYYERNCNNNDNNDIVTLTEKKTQVFKHIITKGIYCLKNVNKYDIKNEIILNEFIKSIMCLICYIEKYPPHLISCYVFLYHFLLDFNKVFNVCFFNDLDKISNPKFYDDLLLLYMNEINNINFEKFYLEFNINKYNENKYFKLIIIHYIIMKRINKLLPHHFNWEKYIQINEDLKNMNELQTKKHYLKYGIKENRIYNINNLIENNSDAELNECSNVLIKNKLYLYDDSYVKSTEHRGGWKSIIDTLKTTILSSDNSLPYLLDLPARTFISEKKILTRDFFMIIHETVDVLQNIGYQQTVSSVINNLNFKQSLKYCKGIITFSYYVKEYILKYDLKIPIFVVKHPTETKDIKLFDLNSFNNNIDKKVVLLGSQLRSAVNIYLLKTTKQKIYLPGTVKYKEEKINTMIKELQHHNISYDQNNLQVTYFDTFEEFDNFIITNIIIIDLIDANANNSIAECIVRNLPFFVNKLPAVIEYLGNDYPMYFTSIEYLESIINNNDKLHKLYKETHEYLKNMDKTDLTLNFFNSEFCNFIQNTKYNAIDIFPIYFPQFHEFEENNINFYNGFNDYKNLIEFNKTADKNDVILKFRNCRNSYMDININNVNYKLNTCDLNFYGEEKYDLVETNIINKQVSLASMCGFKGFALYYYYFSENDNRDNLIMKKAINKFFEVNYTNFNIYFIWCNENWTNSEHFTNNNICNILNTYSDDDINKQFVFLMTYFKHKNYYKINNKPVFAIHFPETLNNITHFWEIGNNVCIQNGFDGLFILIKNQEINHNSIFSYQHHCNYKNSWDNGYTWFYKNDNISYNTVDMKEYYNNYKISPNKINTVLLHNYNNSPRMFKPFKYSKSFIINNETEYCQNYQKKIMNNYDNTNSLINKILHVNAWNEWGENMSIEPSKEDNLKYINQINNYSQKLTIKHIYIPEHSNWEIIENYLTILKKFKFYSNINFIPFFDIYITNNGKQHNDTLIEAKQKYEHVKNIDIGKAPIIENWIGILHNPLNEPIYKIFYNDYYEIKNHLKTCKGLFCISEKLKNDLSQYLKEKNIFIPFIESLYHPMINREVKKFNIDKFWENKNIYQIGNWLRIQKGIIDIKIPHNFNKFIIPKSERTINELKQNGVSNEQLKTINFVTLSDDEYNNLFENSIVFLNLLNSTANNVILECIKSDCPILINNLPSIREYLGDNYPLYYNDYDEIPSIFTYDNILKAHYYIKNMNKEKFSTIQFIEKIYNTLKKNQIIY